MTTIVGADDAHNSTERAWAEKKTGRTEQDVRHNEDFNCACDPKPPSLSSPPTTNDKIICMHARNETSNHCIHSSAATTAKKKHVRRLQCTWELGLGSVVFIFLFVRLRLYCISHPPRRHIVQSTMQIAKNCNAASQMKCSNALGVCSKYSDAHDKIMRGQGRGE